VERNLGKVVPVGIHFPEPLPQQEEPVGGNRPDEFGQVPLDGEQPVLLRIPCAVKKPEIILHEKQVEHTSENHKKIRRDDQRIRQFLRKVLLEQALKHVVS
jgi:hypothetical protein